MTGIGRFRALLLIAGMLPVVAGAFPIEVNEQLGGLPVVFDTSSMADDIAVLRLSNHGDQDVLCTARFKGGPEMPRTRKVRVAAMQTASMTARFNNRIIRMRIQLDCSAAEGEN